MTDLLGSVDWVRIGSILLMLIFISVLIIAHELGHFFVARKVGVKVERFGFGLPFGPTLWSKKIGDVEYCVHAALFGGYVSFPDDDPENPLPKDSPERFENKSIGARFAVMVAGVTVNAILGWLIMLWVILGWGLPSADITILNTFSDHSAAQAGIMAGDRVVKIGGEPIKGYLTEERKVYVRDMMANNAGKKLEVVVERPIDAAGKAVFEGLGPLTTPKDAKNPQFDPKDKPLQEQIFKRLELKPASLKQVSVMVTPDEKGKIGINMTGWPERYLHPDNPIHAAQLTTYYLWGVMKAQFAAFGSLFQGKMNVSELSGPISIVDVGSQVIQRDGVQKGLVLTAIISTILAIMNLLPIPALDGGHIFFLLIEAIKGSPVKQEIREQLTQIGFLGLMALILFILGNDIWNTFIHPRSL